MADSNRYRDDDDEGYIARRGFGNDASGYRQREEDWGYPRRDDDRSRSYSREEARGSYDRGREGSRDPYGGAYRGYERDPDVFSGGRSQDRDRNDYQRGRRGYGEGRGPDEYRAYRGSERDEYRNPERDRGYQGSSSGGYGTGGSALDYRDAESRRSGGYWEDERGFGRSRRYRQDEDYGSSDYGRERDRHSRDDRGFFERAGDEISSWFGDEEAARRRRMDAMRGDEGSQHHRGRGPKGYTRSDERIRDDVNDRLTDDSHIDASDIEVSVQGGEVTLSGLVNSRFEKRHAEDIAETVSGVTHVQNNIRIMSATGTPFPPTTDPLGGAAKTSTATGAAGSSGRDSTGAGLGASAGTAGGRTGTTTGAGGTTTDASGATTAGSAGKSRRS